MPELNPTQVKQYNSYRAEGMSPERALSLATQGDDNQFNPAIEMGTDKILFGKGSLTAAVGRGIKEAFVGGARTIKEDAQNYGAGFAAIKSPLSLVAGVGRGVGEIVGGAIETADDLTGEAASGFLSPYVESAVNSDVGKYLMAKAPEWDKKLGGVPGDILDTLNLVGVGALVKGGSANSIRAALLNTAKKTASAGGDIVGGTFGRAKASLADFFAARKAVNPGVATIDDSLSGITKLLTDKLDNPSIVAALDDIKATLAGKNPATFGDDVMSKLDEILADRKLVDADRAALESYVRKIEDVLNKEDAPSVVDSFLSGAADKVDNLSAKGVGIVEGISDNVIDKGLRAIENIKAIPAAISVRAKQAIDRRIVRTTKNNPEAAREAILDLYKRGVVPGVKKKNKTIANIESIDAAVKRTIPELAKKYDVEDLEDFANVISIEKKAIFSEIEKGLVDAGNKGRSISTEPIVKELDALLASERAEFSQELKNAIAKARKNLVDEVDGVETPKTMTPTGAQDVIADLNAQLQSYYRGSTSGTNADVIVDNLVVNNLRKAVDGVVEDLGEGTFKELKARYGDLKKMEDDVVHRAVFEAQKGSGLASDMTDILSAGDVIAGSFINPVFLAKGTAQYFTKEVIKSLSDKNELIRQMFLYGKNL